MLRAWTLKFIIKIDTYQINEMVVRTATYKVWFVYIWLIAMLLVLKCNEFLFNWLLDVLLRHWILLYPSNPSCESPRLIIPLIGSEWCLMMGRVRRVRTVRLMIWWWDPGTLSRHRPLLRTRPRPLTDRHSSLKTITRCSDERRDSQH